MKKNKSFIKQFFKAVIIGLAIALVFTNVFRVFAGPPGSPYAPGETRDPTCAPGSTNCTVTAPAVSGANSDITSLTGLTTALTVGQGGTGIATAPTAHGQLLMASSTGWVVGSLIAGSNITLTTSTPGQITIAASAGGGGVSTSSPFTAGYIPYATSSSAIADSNIFQLGSSIGIGTTTPSSLLTINNGSLDLIGNGGNSGQYKYDGLNMLFASSTTNNYFAFNAGNSTATGTLNIAIGSSSLRNLQGGSGNLAIGIGAMGSSTIDISSSTAIGYKALYANTTGQYNTAVGYESLKFNTSGLYNTAVGYQTMYSNAAGEYNTALGYQALYNANGASAAYNIAVGYQALYSISYGSNNTAVGVNALGSSGGGNYNVGIGNNALRTVGNAEGNVGVGYYSLYNSYGNHNVGIGFHALESNYAGSGNSVLGTYAGYGIGGGTTRPVSSSTIIGYRAGYRIATSSANILIGYQAGYGLASSSHNIVIGHNSDLPSTSTSTLNIANLIYATNLSQFSEATTTVSGGNVGIGTSTPAYSLVVGDGTTQKDIYIAKGGLCVSSDNADCPATPAAGVIYASSTSITGIDLAENYPTLESDLSAGEVAALDEDNPGHIRKSRTAYEPGIIGVISTAPGVLLGKNISGDNLKPVALAGRVPVKISLENGAINIGDRLTSANQQAGWAMKATENGNIIGIALEPLAECETEELCKIMVFVKPQWSWSQLDENIMLGNLADNVSADAVTESLSLSDKFAALVQSILRKLGMYLEDGVARIKELFAEKVSTKELCVGETCVTEEQLKALLNQAGFQPAGTPESAPEPKSAPESEPEPESAPEAEPETESAPSSEIAPEPPAE